MKSRKILLATILVLTLGGCATTQGTQTVGDPRDVVDQADKARRQAEDARWDMERIGRHDDPFDKAGAVFDVLEDVEGFGK